MHHDREEEHQQNKLGVFRNAYETNNHRFGLKKASVDHVEIGDDILTHPQN